ncbi:G-type lectin S-receptor-like serine/threonine-protein kinase At1g11410 isoform X1 [Durio zibethinus]|uniref:Receptor-like serine/threonine-protein kinase n=1 Tax=Durio zibethinus TaxID=66656 RepID=A0A6P5WJB7_DURZI|nr:G-type lectin S-receptor-like serine/threonine-protein kinase At1g11410 isoform X1 [Durio zibethinus]
MNPVKWFVKALLLSCFFHLSLSFDTITSQHSIKDGDVVVSSGNTFALGFFSPGNTKYRYVGIWYYQIPKKTVVWVANREHPINDTSGTLSISSQGNLVLYQKNQTILVWSTNPSVTHSKNSVARLLDSGNLLLVHNGTTFWQSFDYPSNTVLPFMKIGLNLSTGLNRFVTPWKSPDNPGIGNYTYKIDPSGFPQLCFYKGSVKFWRGGSWTGRRWVGVPEMTRSHIFNFSFVYNNEEIFLMFGINNASIISILVANETGLLTRFTWNPEDQRWVLVWSAPKEECDYYGHCGPNSNCDQTHEDKLECSCLPGFEPKSPQTWFLRDWSAGCARKRNASICQHGEGFVKVARVKVPDTAVANADMSLGLKQCKDKCLRNCSCTAYASAFSELNGETGCLTWHGDLVDIKTYRDAGQDIYIRVDAVDLGRKRRPPLSFTASPTHLEDPLNGKNAELPLFNLGTIAAATNNFSSDNKLGQGGFGPVYKGILSGKETAVKRLSKSSGQGIEEFKNEVTLIAKLQHRNLVRILGCCIEKEEKMLIYEYLPNKSLDSFIFDERKRSLLDWGTRFKIFCGIARGIVYLHQDSRLRIIHRDLKASNILLDAEMNPKISDFGMARIFGGDQVEAKTKRVVGTYGYMSPEYAMQGHFSVKSDVYSFGVLLLEIITGRRNIGYYPDSPTSNFIGHVSNLIVYAISMKTLHPVLIIQVVLGLGSMEKR